MTKECKTKITREHASFKKALQDIKSHIEVACGDTMYKYSTVWNIADRALKMQDKTNEG